jgi:hypothetical protein
MLPITRLRTSEVAFYALDDLYQQDLETAEKRINSHIDLLSSINTDFKSEIISDDVVTLGKFLSLAQNLGKPENKSDNLSKNSQVISHALNEFGRVRNGFNQRQ